MKKVLLFSAALFVIALGMGVSASAETKKIGNFKYEYDSAPNGNDENYAGYGQRYINTKDSVQN